MKSTLSTKRRVSGFVLKGLVYLCAGITVALLAGLLGYILYRGLGSISWEFLSTVSSALKNTIGILPNILYTLYIIATALIIALPIGVGAAIYLNEYALNRRLVSVI